MPETCTLTEFYIQKELYLIGKKTIQQLSSRDVHLQMDGLGYFLRTLFPWALRWISATVSVRR